MVDSDRSEGRIHEHRPDPTRCREPTACGSGAGRAHRGHGKPRTVRTGQRGGHGGLDRGCSRDGHHRVVLLEARGGGRGNTPHEECRPRRNRRRRRANHRHMGLFAIFGVGAIAWWLLRCWRPTSRLLLPPARFLQLEARGQRRLGRALHADRRGGSEPLEGMERLRQPPGGYCQCGGEPAVRLTLAPLSSSGIRTTGPQLHEDLSSLEPWRSMCGVMESSGSSHRSVGPGTPSGAFPRCRCRLGRTTS